MSVVSPRATRLPFRFAVTLLTTAALFMGRGTSLQAQGAAQGPPAPTTVPGAKSAVTGFPVLQQGAPTPATPPADRDLAPSTVGISEPTPVATAAPAAAVATRARKDSLTRAGVVSKDIHQFLDAWVGRSGKLLARFVAPQHTMNVPLLSALFGDADAGEWTPGMQRVQDPEDAERRPFALFGMRSFGEKSDGYVNGYRMGFWPSEKGRHRSAAYENPEGFIEVTKENQDMYVSEHFRLRDFLTHNQEDVWPKYMVLREDLVDKLELVIEDLNEHGVKADHMRVLSGFRSPQYNNDLGDASGRARDSRHQFGDAADVYIDNDGDGRMDDLNHDGKVDFADAKVILKAVERVEAEYPDLVGGVGLYHATGSHGPFAHIDVRGSRARWIRGGSRTRPRHKSRARHGAHGTKAGHKGAAHGSRKATATRHGHARAVRPHKKPGSASKHTKHAKTTKHE
jgi:uncharacterized protein YcbK (DUF882 family)